MSVFGLSPFGTALGPFGGAGLITVLGLIPEGRGSVVVVFDRPVFSTDSFLWYSASNPTCLTLAAVDPSVTVSGQVVVPTGKVVPTHSVLTAQSYRDSEDPTQVHVDSDSAFERGVDYQVTVSPSIRGLGGETFAGPSQWVFKAPGSKGDVTIRGAAFERYRDFRYRFAEDPKEPSAKGGTYAISRGDIEIAGGSESLRKRLIRRAITARGGFSWSPTYGVRAQSGKLLTRGVMVQLSTEIAEQVRLEPEVTQAAVDVTEIAGRPGFLVVRIFARTRTQNDVVVSVEMAS